MARVSCDFGSDEKIKDVLSKLREHHGKIVDFNPEGPGGGNPCILLQFPSPKEGLAYLVERYPDDSRQFSRSRIY